MESHSVYIHDILRILRISCLKNVIFNVFKDSDLRIYQKLLATSDSCGFKRIMGR